MIRSSHSVKWGKVCDETAIIGSRVSVTRGERTMRTSTSVAVEPVGDDILIIMRSGLPVNGLHTTFEVAGRTELPFTNDCPNYGGNADGSAYSDQDDDCVPGDACGGLVIAIIIGRRSSLRRGSRRGS